MIWLNPENQQNHPANYANTEPESCNSTDNGLKKEGFFYLLSTRSHSSKNAIMTLSFVCRLNGSKLSGHYIYKWSSCHSESEPYFTLSCFLDTILPFHPGAGPRLFWPRSQASLSVVSCPETLPQWPLLTI